MCDSAGCRAMSDDDPPPQYTVIDETKTNLALQPTGSTSFNTETVPCARTGYDTVAYYPTSSSASASVPLQPQQVVIIQPPQVVIVPAPVQRQPFTTHILISCLSCFCCWSCPCSVVALILACESACILQA